MAALILIVFIDLVGFGIIIPLLPFYGERFDATPAEVGLLMATYSLTQFLAAPAWGRLSDRAGRRPVLLASLAGISGAYVWLAFAENLWALFAARALAGAMAGNIAVAFAYVADITDAKTRARGMGLIGAAFGLGFIFGPAIGGVLAGADPADADFRTPALVAAGLSAVAFALATVSLKESVPKEVRARQRSMTRAERWGELREIVTRPTVSLLLALAFLASFVFSGLETSFPMWSRRQFGWGPEQNGYLFAFVGLLTAVVQAGFVGRLARRFGEGPLVVYGAGALAIGMLLIPFSASLGLLIAAMVVVALGFSLISPSLNSLISLEVGAEARGGAMGVSRSAITLARILGPIWAGALFFFLGRHWPYFGGAVVMVFVLILSLRIPALTRPSAPTAANEEEPERAG